MDQQVVQHALHLLQARYRRVRMARAGHFEPVCRQVLQWLENHPVLGSMIAYLDNVPGEHHQEIELLRKYSKSLNGARYHVVIHDQDTRQEHERDFRGYTPTTIDEHASACLQSFRAAIDCPNYDFFCLLAVYITQEEYDELLSVPRRGEAALNVVKETIVLDLFEYLEEQLGGLSAVNGLLHKYRQYAEWFHTSELRAMAEGYEDIDGEHALALHLQQYIFDQGVEFSIEPTSASGEIDLVLRDSFGHFILIDAKYVKEGSRPSEITRKISRGFNQVARYCSDYNQPEGFLAVFVDDDMAILIDLEQNGGTRYLKVGGYTIYYIEINISARPSASKAGRAKQITISRDSLVGQIGDLFDEPEN